MPSVSGKTIIDLELFIFLVLTEIILKQLLCQHVIIMILWHWPITVSHHWPPDLAIILTAMSKQKSTISKPIDGTTLLIILLARKYLFMISWFLIYSQTLRSQRYIQYSVASTNQAAFFIGGRHGSSPSSVIAKYENDEWFLYGNLKKRRRGHGSITSGTATIVIGGVTDDGS